MFDWWMWLIIGITWGVMLQKNWRRWWLWIRLNEISILCCGIVVGEVVSLVGMFICGTLGFKLALYGFMGLGLGVLAILAWIYWSDIKQILVSSLKRFGVKVDAASEA